jgi:hypothetical protein
MVEAVNRCMDAISASGLSADGAEYLPACLDQAIRASNQVTAQNTQFHAAHVSVKEIDGGYDVTPFELRFVR